MLILVVSALGSADRLLQRIPTLGTFRFLGPALRLTHELHEFYAKHRPRLLVFYLFYPLYAVIGAIVSPAVRREVKLHGKLQLIITALFLLETAGEYWAVHRQHLSVMDSAPLLAQRLGLVLILAVIYLMPTTTTVYMLDLSGRRRTLRAIVATIALVSVPFIYLVHQRWDRSTSISSAQVLKKRMLKPSFRQDLRDIGAMFISYHARYRMSGPVAEAPTYNEVLTRRFRKVIFSDLPDDERLSFSVITLRDPTTGHAWLGLRYASFGRPTLLMVAAPNGTVYRRWAELPAWIPQRFHVSSRIDPKVPRYHWLAHRAMEEDLPTE